MNFMTGEGGQFRGTKKAQKSQLQPPYSLDTKTAIFHDFDHFLTTFWPLITFFSLRELFFFLTQIFFYFFFLTQIFFYFFFSSHKFFFGWLTFFSLLTFFFPHQEFRYVKLKMKVQEKDFRIALMAGLSQAPGSHFTVINYRSMPIKQTVGLCPSRRAQVDDLPDRLCTWTFASLGTSKNY